MRVYDEICVYDARICIYVFTRTIMYVLQEKKDKNEKDFNLLELVDIFTLVYLLYNGNGYLYMATEVE